MKKALGILALALALCAGCQTTTVAVNSPVNDTATFRAGVFYGQIGANQERAYRATKEAFKQLDYFFSGEITQKTSQTLIARALGDVRIEVKLMEPEAGVVTVRIAYGRGDLANSQRLFNKIMENI